VTWQCFWMEPTFEAEQGLRRYASASDGTGCEGGYHSAHVFLDQRITISIKALDDGWQVWDYGLADGARPETPHDDPRWPTHCERGCGYEFTPDDHYQDWTEPLYRRADDGELRVLHWSMVPTCAPTAEPGAMWHAFWHERWQEGGGGILSLNPDRPRDGIILQVRCPYMDDRSPSRGGQDWGVDHASSSGGYWTRTGDPRDPPSLSASPSIAIGVPGSSGYYHSFLTNGVLGDHLG
jgi:hypothetical protein